LVLGRVGSTHPCGKVKACRPKAVGRHPAQFMSTVSVFLATLVVIAAPEPAPQPRPALYFPTRVGDAWVYLHTDSAGKQWEVAEEVIAVKEKDRVRVVTIGRTHTDGKVYPNRIREVSDRGVIQTTSDGIGLPRAPLIHLLLPHKPGQSWENKFNFPGTRTAYGPEKVKVPAGEFESFRVEEWRRGKPNSELVQTEWYAPGRGIVKLTAPRLTIEMKSFTRGK
jgi:hypothetical protein